MRRAFSCVVLLACLSVAVRLGAQSLDDAAVREAMQSLNPPSNAFDLTWRCGGDFVFTGGVPKRVSGPPRNHIFVSGGPEVRIGLLAAYFKQSGRTLSVSDVPSWMRDRSTMFVTVYRTDGDASEVSRNTDDPIGDVQSLTLRSTLVSSQVLKPQYLEVAPGDTPKAGLRSRADGAFTHASVAGLPAGSIDIVVGTRAGEWYCTMGVKDRAKFAR